MMYDDLEQALVRELDDVAGHLVVPERPTLPAVSTGRSRWRSSAPLLAAAAVVAVLATVATLLASDGPDRTTPSPAPSPATPTDTASPGADPGEPVAVALDLYVGGEQVSGRWYEAEGEGTRWVGLRDDGSWWWGYDVQPQQLEGTMEQPPAISADGRYLARVLSEDGRAVLTGSDTDEGGEGFGGVELPGRSNPPARAVAVTDEGLVVAGGSSFQWLWRPLVDNETVDLAETAPGQVVIGSTDAGLLVNAGEYGETDGQLGEPWLARLSPDGTLTRLVDVPRHDVLEARGDWLAYVPPGTVGGEASGTTEVWVQRLDGSAAGVLTAPDGWLFMAPGFRWESGDRLLALVVSRDGGDERLLRCRPDTTSCVPVDLP